MPPKAKKTGKKIVKGSKPTKSGPVKSNMEELDAMLTDLYDMRQQAKTLADDIEDVQEKALKEMESLGVTKRIVKTKDGRRLNASGQQSKTYALDEPRLKKRVGAKLWNKISTRRFDKRKGAAFIASGELTEAIVAECTTENPGKKFIKVQG